MAALTTQTITSAGATITYALAAASDTAEIGGGGDTFLHLKNTSAAPATYTIQVPGTTFFGATTPDNGITVPAGQERMVMLRKEYDDGTGRATVTTSPTGTGVTLAVVRVG